MKPTIKLFKSGLVVAGILAAFLAFTPSSVKADDPLTITIDEITVTPGETGVVVAGDISNNTSGPSAVTVNLDSDSENVPLAVSGSIDDTDYFFTDAPLSLDPGQDSGFIDLFSFDVSPTAAPGLYVDDATFDVLQLDSSSPTGYDIVGTESFTIDVVSSTAVPEPASLSMLVSGLLGLGGLAFARRKQEA